MQTHREEQHNTGKRLLLDRIVTCKCGWRDPSVMLPLHDHSKAGVA